MLVDSHQHVWTAPLLAALSERKRLPFVRRTDGLTVLHCVGERPYVIDVESEQREAREGLLRADGLDLAVVALSSPIGIEALPRAEAQELIDAHLSGVGALGPAFAAWGPVPLDRPDSDDVDAVLARGCVGVSLPAYALAGPERLAAIGGLLERAATRGVPVFVHPAPCPPSGGGEASLTEPLWWRALTDYVAQMQAAWLSFVTHGRRAHPDLSIVFAMLAGGAPMLSERLETRGGPDIDLADPRTFYDTSSYGPAAIGWIESRVGIDQLVYGSDRPVIEPWPTPRDDLLKRNAGAVLAAAAGRVPA